MDRTNPCSAFAKGHFARVRAAVLVGALLTSFTLVAAQVGPVPPKNLRLDGDVEPPPKAPAPKACELPPLGGPRHAYFDSLVRRSEHFCNYSLREQAQLDALVADPVATFFTYNPSADSYRDKQDAAKLVRPAGGSSSVPGAQQLRMPMGRKMTSGSLLITWDWYWGPEFQTNRGGVNHYKMFQLIIDGHAWWTLMANLAWADLGNSGEVAKVSDELRSGVLADGMVVRSPWTPAGAGAADQRNRSGSQYHQKHGTWTRYWIEVNMLQPPSAFTDWSQAYLGGRTLGANPEDPEGRWHMVSLWSADEDRPARRLLYRVPINWNAGLGWEPHVSMFRFEMNTSQPPLSLTGPLIGYGRNVVFLQNYRLPAVPETDSYLFQKPIR
jgi:hypothetical protein